MSIKYSESGEKVRVSKRSGAVIPWPAVLKTRRAARAPEPGPKDTPLAAVRAATYVPPPGLAAFLGPASGLYAPRSRARTDAARAAHPEREPLPRHLRTATLRRGVRLDERRKWGAKVQRACLERDVQALLLAHGGGGGGAGGGAAAAAAAAAGAVAQQPQLR